MDSNEIVIGIDPGTHRCGFGLVVRRGNRFVHIAHGVVKAPTKAPLHERLLAVADGIEQVVAAHGPVAMAIEGAFFHRDAHAAMILGHARGAVMVIAARRNMAVAEYAPAVVKKAVVGNGNADKEQVNRMIQAILALDTRPEFDASDALAIAICHASASALTARLPAQPTTVRKAVVVRGRR